MDVKKPRFRLGLQIFLIIITVAAVFLIGRISAQSFRSGPITDIVRKSAGRLADSAGLSDRALVLSENPGIIPALAEGAKFGGEKLSTLVAQNLFSANPDITDEIRKKTSVYKISPGTWFIRLPLVNAALFETSEGLILVDTGMAAAGPVIREIIEEVSEKQLKVIVYTHYHVDHAYGTWALTEGWDEPVRIISHEFTARNFDRYKRFTGTLARLMSQNEDQIIEAVNSLVYPTETFSDTMIITLGGEKFELYHAPGETEDQLYFWAPERKILESADYHQGFLPNAGNGKRVQRYVEEWAAALRDMAALKPEIILPGHGSAMTDPDSNIEELTVLSDALNTIVEQVIEGLNSGLRPDEAIETIELPEELLNYHTLRTVYATPRDIARMVAKRYSGWWDGLPSSYNPPPMTDLAMEITELAGGLEVLIDKAYETALTDIAVACRLADYAWLAYPDEPSVQQLVLDIYGERITIQARSTQEMLAYLDHMTAVRAAMRRH